MGFHTPPRNIFRNRKGKKIFPFVLFFKPLGKKKKKKKKKRTQLAPIIKIKLPLNHVLFSCVIETGATIAVIFKVVLVGKNQVVANMLPVVLVRRIVRIIIRRVVLHGNLQERAGMRKKGGKKKKKKKKRKNIKKISTPLKRTSGETDVQIGGNLAYPFLSTFFFLYFFFFFFFSFSHKKYNGGFSVHGRK
jgi:hypothetical protein